MRRRLDLMARAASLRPILLYASESTGRLVLAAVGSIVLARYLGPASLGALGFVTSVFAILLPLATLGMAELVVRDLATAPEDRSLLAAALWAQVPAAVLATLIAAGFTVAVRGSTAIVLVLPLLLLLPSAAIQATARAVHITRGQAGRVARAGLGATVVVLAMRVGAVFASMPLWVFALLVTIEGAFVAGAMVLTQRPLDRRAMFRRSSLDRVRPLAKEARPLVVAGFAVVLYMQADIIMLGAIASDRVTGLYVIAVRIAEASYAIPLAVMASRRPLLARSFMSEDASVYEAALGHLLRRVVLVGIALAVILGVSGPVLVPLVFGEGYGASVEMLQMLVVAIPAVYLGVIGSPWFVDHRLLKVRMVFLSTGALVNLGLNALLIPRMGGRGAAIATVVAYWTAAVFLNAFHPSTRPLLRLQMRALALPRWPSSRRPTPT